MLKKSKLTLAASLIVQSITFFVLFCALWCKKKSLAAAFLAVSAVSGATGAVLIAQLKREIADTTVEFDDDFEMDEAALKGSLNGGDVEE